ncbi:MAG: hypothetical protein AAGI01_18600, partial [Myxococcota bacterium]
MTRETQMSLRSVMGTMWWCGALVLGLAACAPSEERGAGALAVPEIVFEPVPIGQSLEVVVPIENVGDTPLTLTHVALVEQDVLAAAELELKSPWASEVELEPGARARVRVVWTPADSLPDRGALEITLGTGDVERVVVRTPELFGGLVVESAVEFGDIPLREDISRTVELSNDGEGVLT